jgi:hypothetical protein
MSVLVCEKNKLGEMLVQVDCKKVHDHARPLCHVTQLNGFCWDSVLDMFILKAINLRSMLMHTTHDTEYGGRYRILAWQSKSCDSFLAGTRDFCFLCGPCIFHVSEGKGDITSHLLLVQRLRMGGAIPSLSHVLSWRAQKLIGRYMLHVLEMEIKVSFAPSFF